MYRILAMTMSMVVCVVFSAPTPLKAGDVTTSEARAIAKEAYFYGFPMVDSYRVHYAYFVDTKSADYKTSWNKIFNTAHVYTPTDTAIQTPNSDTPYSFVGLDLRAEPIVLTLPAIEKERTTAYSSSTLIHSISTTLAAVRRAMTAVLSSSSDQVGPASLPKV